MRNDASIGEPRGSVVCPSCGSLVGVRDDKCYTCGRSNPGLWGFGPVLRQPRRRFRIRAAGRRRVRHAVGDHAADVGRAQIRVGSIMSALAPSTPVLFLFGASGAIPVFSFGRWWTVLSAGWLHAGLLHIAMNMYWVWQMGPVIDRDARPGADGHHLHGRRRGRVRAQLGRRRVSAGPPVPARRAASPSARRRRSSA